MLGWQQLIQPRGALTSLFQVLIVPLLGLKGKERHV